MSQIYDLKVRIEEKLQAAGASATELRGKVGLKSGMLLSLISASTVDDPAKIAKLKLAAKEVLQLSL